MVILDSNIFIYAGKGDIPLEKLENITGAYASISAIEVLGYQHITVAEQRALMRIFDALERIELSQPIIDTAIALRQERKMSLGDGIVAATALDCDAELWTANVQDFTRVEKLKLYNPVNTSG